MTPTALDDLTDAEIAHFRAFGFVVARQAFDAASLSEEVDRALADGLTPMRRSSAQAGIDFGYVPMMCERTPVSVALLDRFSAAASRLLGGDALPVRAKAVRYHGASVWHRDSELPVDSIGVVAYLEPLDATSGALRVLPGSHHHSYATALAQELSRRGEPQGVETDGGFAGTPLETRPGDIIVFDEHLYHASHGGAARRQWRADYFALPHTDTATTAARMYLAAMYRPGWSGSYDTHRYPTYGPHWRATPRACHEHLERLGAYRAARTQ
jgi:ectoine hydroxylase-related dioxygenase (phytanoyl-CoA dioxygenase family)